MPPRPLLAVWIALVALVPIAAFMANGVVLSLAVMALGAPGITLWPRWLRLRMIGLVPIAISALLMWMAITAPWALDPGEAAGKALRLPGLFLLALAAIALGDCASPELARRMVRALALAMVGLIALVGIEFAAGGLFLRQAKDYHRELLVLGLDMTLSQYTIWRVQHALTRSAVVLLALGPLVICSLVNSSISRNLIYAVIGAGLLMVLMLPFTMAQLAMAVAATGAAVAWYRPRLAGSMLTIILLGLLMGLPLLALVIDPVHPFGFDAPHWPPGIQHRLYIWHFTAERITERPWAGWGLESARAIPGGETIVRIFKDGMPITDDAVMLPLHPHNVLLQIWLEGGTIGAMLAGAGILGLGPLLARLRADRKLYAASIASTCAIATLALTSVGLWQEWFLALIALTFAFAVISARAKLG